MEFRYREFTFTAALIYLNREKTATLQNQNGSPDLRWSQNELH